ncbi:MULTISPECIES: class I SAM-dependent methyltransferase [Paenibacillus]|uniref:SAM-dependent methyltransferase n=1 Tax=Paenibacillus TaxID=44249 RepID=UPI0004F7E4AA|nr:SAM-dependent methyltransferase [Paenibacillus odorifer]AIQ73813.1 SAM-dependent methyltransferase [Paenibacillus odorifer]MEC0130743.1 SAM-dependent methyltransferase [Paenibacillus odorifer]MEC0220949.1 SAM-dependent methyltransferase [Paenibacillus odorifer]OME33007.1 SAM-dependent methyltransferase [Paenibacillus odorifer]OME49854.1 SAM-dependent methyltransferase [Paenibacillus odorifer]
MSGAKGKLDLERIVFIGRTYEEYLRMFDLLESDLIGQRILDCPAGACSFTAIANQLGGAVTAADIAYYYSEDELADKGVQDIAHAMSGMEKVQDNFVWNYFKSIEGLTEARNAALTASTKDRRQTPERYVPVVLPDLPFADEAFDLTLSAHFLFMYSDRLDYGFHLKTIKKLMRVTRGELRIFPLVDLSCKRYEHLDRLIDDLVRQGFTAEELEVPYEFQKGAKQMLKIRRAELFL